MDVVTQRDNECGRIVVPERVHLLTADDVVTEGHRCRTYLALCGVLLAEDSLPESLHPEGCECDTERLYCPECVREAARCAADAGLVEHGPSRGHSGQDGDDGSVGYVTSANGPPGVNGGTVGFAAGTRRG